MAGLLKNALNSLIRVSSDAQSNLYRIKFSGGVFGDENTSNYVIVRNSGIEVPTPTQEVYQTKYITAYVDRPVTKVGLVRNFPIEFRMDSHWELYKALLKQQKQFSNFKNSFVNSSILDADGNLIEDKFFTVEVEAILELAEDEESASEKLFTFRHCWISSITPPSFDTGSSDPITVSCQINFLEMDDYQSENSLAEKALERTSYK